MSRNPYSYAVIRVMPVIARGEFINVGVVMFCRRDKFLAAKFDPQAAKRCRALWPALDIEAIKVQLSAIELICVGGSKSHYFADLSQSERFTWLVSPASTIVQPSPVHSGLTGNPVQTLAALYRLLVSATA